VPANSFRRKEDTHLQKIVAAFVAAGFLMTGAAMASTTSPGPSAKPASKTSVKATAAPAKSSSKTSPKSTAKPAKKSSSPKPSSKPN